MSIDDIPLLAIRECVRLARERLEDGTSEDCYPGLDSYKADTCYDAAVIGCDEVERWLDSTIDEWSRELKEKKK